MKILNLLFCIVCYVGNCQEVKVEAPLTKNNKIREVDSIFQKVIADSCKQVLLYHEFRNNYETEGIISWNKESEPLGIKFKTRNGKIYSVEFLKFKNDLKIARDLYFSNEGSAKDTIGTRNWQSSHDYWIDFRSFNNGNYSFHTVRSIEVLFNKRPTGLVQSASIFNDLIYKDED